MTSARGAAPHILHLLPDSTPQAAARTAMLIAAFGRAYRHSILAADPGQRQWLGGNGGSVAWLTGFPELAGAPTPGRLNRLARASTLR